jgi:DNA modification methylase
MIINANALAIPLEDETVQTTVTSPPYYGLRNYGTAKWIGGLETCDHAAAKIKSRYDYAMQEGSRHADIAASTQGTDGGKYKMVCPTCGAQKIDDQIGLEESPEEYVQKLVAVFREVWRVTKADGTLWLNLGDSYVSNGNYSIKYEAGKNRKALSASDVDKYATKDPRPGAKKMGLKPKDLIGIPWMVAFALRADGWYLRRDIIWSKNNPMPESVTDRCTTSHEYIFHFSKSPKYYYDQDAIREPYAEASLPRGLSEDNKWADGAPGSTAHTMSKPRENVRKEFEDEHGGGGTGFKGHSGYRAADGRLLVNPLGRNKWSVWTVPTKSYTEAHFATYPPDLIEPCILAGSRKGDIVLDPFSGSGTTGQVATAHGREYVGLELNYEYIKMSRRRLAKTQINLL